ncbi:MAG: rhomboid family intramembrane serine protease [Pirellulales bacterium]|nr:rhomboid family intramembrane serine protease [Pirellulales bacterium]
MLFPYSTDAPIYHWPFTTIAFIVVNVAVFYAEMAAPEAVVGPYMLVFGDGLHPVQWLTNNFLHAGILHLLGNMLSLWSFGLIVEGKLGWKKTLAVYLGIGVAYGAIVQTIMLGSSGGAPGALGASGIVFGLMAMSLVWAPENNVQCLLLLVFWPIYFEIKVVVLVGIFLFFQIGLLLLNHMAMSSELLHVIGAALGFIVAVWMLRGEMVDCEHWDVFSVWAGRHTMSPEERERAEGEIQQSLPDDLLVAQINQIIQSGKPALALRAHQRMSETVKDWILPRNVLWDLIQGLHRERLWGESVPVMEEYLKNYSHQAAQMQLKLSHIMLAEQARPASALELLKGIDRSNLDARGIDLLEKLRTKAEEMLGSSLQ